jgi:hypothetical protein
MWFETRCESLREAASRFKDRLKFVIANRVMPIEKFDFLVDRYDRLENAPHSRYHQRQCNSIDLSALLKTFLTKAEANRLIATTHDRM